MTTKEVEIRSEPVELYKLLKFEGLVGSGGEAKLVISDGLVRLNGAVETRKRKKLIAGDTVEFGGEKFRLRLEGVTG
ncbi:MAG: RNA-binding S4 domain-containing protein [Immundisolibacteraceae bacterium]|nr:RNA-binding S4 domain-containing protein [Immundisolibacteraceae bacterium]